LSKNSRNFSVFLFFGLEISSMNFGKSRTIYEIFCSVLLEGLEILPTIAGKF